MTIHILGGGTFSHVRSHLALAAPAFGGTARELYRLHKLIDDRANHVDDLYQLNKNVDYPANRYSYQGTNPVLHLTKMADHDSSLVTNQDVARLVDQLIANPHTRVIYFNVALTDFDGQIDDAPSGKYAERLKSRDGERTMTLTMADKIIGRIRKDRKDIFVVGFKTTAGATSNEQYLAGLNLLKANSINLVVANDLVTRNNMIITPEESRYCETTDRQLMLETLVKMVDSRRQNTFTRSTVLPGDLVSWVYDERVPDNLRRVVNYMVENGAYQVVQNATVGHFAVRGGVGKCFTSRRKTDYTKPEGLDLVEVEYQGIDEVIAYGAKPSVGGQSQRIIFDTHPDVDCIAHAHVEMRPDARDRDKIAMDMGQWARECGSHDCGRSVSDLIPSVKGVRAVMIHNHGPNIVFPKETPAEEIIDFIDANFDLSRKTGGNVFA